MDNLIGRQHEYLSWIWGIAKQAAGGGGLLPVRLDLILPLSFALISYLLLLSLALISCSYFLFFSLSYLLSPFISGYLRSSPVVSSSLKAATPRP